MSSTGIISILIYKTHLHPPDWNAFNGIHGSIKMFLVSVWQNRII